MQIYVGVLYRNVKRRADQKQMAILKIGFDLDMTLIESSEAIVKSVQATLREFNREKVVPEVEIRQSVGVPISKSLEHWISGESARAAYEFYKKYYVENALHLTTAMPGALDLISQLSTEVIEYCIITAKDKDVAIAQLSFLGFPDSVVFGGRFGHQKTEAMIEYGCTHYVGDHLEDYKSAKKANVIFIGVDFNPYYDLRSNIPANLPVFSTLEEIVAYSRSI